MLGWHDWLLEQSVVPIAPYNPRNTNDPPDIEYRSEERIKEHSNTVRLRQHELNETYTERSRVEKAIGVCKDFGLGARGSEAECGSNTTSSSLSVFGYCRACQSPPRKRCRYPNDYTMKTVLHHHLAWAIQRLGEERNTVRFDSQRQKHIPPVPPPNMDRGVLYFAKGEKFVSEAESSARRAKQVLGDPHITLVTDTSCESSYIDNVIIDNSEFKKSDKPRSLLKSPYKRTLYLDSDIWIEEDITEVFDILNGFDLGVVKDPLEPHVHDIEQNHPVEGVPEAFPEFNSGFIIYNQTTDVINMLKDWTFRCNPADDRDQRSFRPALFHSNVNMTALPPRYNCMYRTENSLNGMVKVFHGQMVKARSSDHGYHGITLEDAIEEINRYDGSRVSFRYRNQVIVIPPIPSLTHLQFTLEQEGVRETLKGIGKYLKRTLSDTDRSDVDNRK